MCEVTILFSIDVCIDVLQGWHSSQCGVSTGNSVILRLAKNDQVYVLTADATDLYGSTTEVYGTFSGYLISGVYEEFNVVG